MVGSERGREPLYPIKLIKLCHAFSMTCLFVLLGSDSAGWSAERFHVLAPDWPSDAARRFGWHPHYSSGHSTRAAHLPRRMKGTRTWARIIKVRVAYRFSTVNCESRLGGGMMGAVEFESIHDEEAKKTRRNGIGRCPMRRALAACQFRSSSGAKRSCARAELTNRPSISVFVFRVRYQTAACVRLPPLPD